MLKFLRVVCIAVGIVLIVATLGLMIWNVIQINQLVTTADAANMLTNPNPRYWVMLGVGGALVGGFALGLGLGMPKQTFKQRLADHVEQEDQSENPA